MRQRRAILQTPSMNHRAPLVFAIAVVISGALTACAQSAPLSASSPTASSTLAPQSPTATSMRTLSAVPTHVSWAVDKFDNAARPYALVLFFDNGAMGFRIVDSASGLVLQVPIAGSGVFGSQTCMARARPSGKTENSTWIAVDSGTLQHFMTNAGSYHVQVIAIEGPAFDLPLTDTGCRAP